MIGEIKTCKTKKMEPHLWYIYKPGKKAILEIKILKKIEQRERKQDHITGAMKL